jgi:hypothetical protein
MNPPKDAPISGTCDSWSGQFEAKLKSASEPSKKRGV